MPSVSLADKTQMELEPGRIWGFQVKTLVGSGGTIWMMDTLPHVYDLPPYYAPIHASGLDSTLCIVEAGKSPDIPIEPDRCSPGQ